MVVSNADSVIAAIAQKAQTGTVPQPGTTGGNAENVIGQIAANGGKVPETPLPPEKTEEQEPDFFKGSPSIPGQAIQESQTMSPEKFKAGAATAGNTALAGATAGSIALGIGGALAPAASTGTAEQLASGIKVFRNAATGQFVKAEGPSLVGRIPGILKSAYDWASANPLKAYVIYKVAEESGIGPSGLKKVFHLFSGAGAE